MKFYSFLFPLVFFSITQCFSQVSLNTGKAQVNYTLFNYTDANRLTFSVNLNYSGGGGIKVNELATEVGLGWDMLLGGVISRQQIGEPDDQSREGVPGSILLSGYIYAPIYPSSYPNPILGWVPISTGFGSFNHVDANAADKQQDIFNFSFNGQSGSFVITKSGDCVSLNNSRLKISKVNENMVSNNVVTHIGKFIIVGDDGIEYTFSEKQFSRIYNHGGSIDSRGVLPEFSGSGGYSLSRSSYILTEYSIVTDWYLSQIRNPLTNKTIQLNYEGYDLTFLDGRRPSLSKTMVNGEPDTHIINIQDRFKGVLKRITSIVFPDEKKLEFEYNTYDRTDLPGSRSLNKMLVKQGNDLLYGYQFSYKYFSKGDLRDINYSFPVAEAPNARMCLTSYKKFGLNNVSEQPYEFSYYQGPGENDKESWVPPRNSIMQDYFGFYNNIAEGAYEGSNENETAQLTFYNLHRLFDRAARNRLPYTDPARIAGGVNNRFAVAKNGALKKVKLPNGGSLEFEYEANSALGSTGPKVMGGVRVSKVLSRDGLNAANDMITEYRYVREDGVTSGWGYEEPDFDESRRAIYKPPTGSAQYHALSTVYSLALNPQVRNAFISIFFKSNLAPQGYYAAKSSSAVKIIAAVAVVYVLRLLLGGGSIKTIDTDVSVITPLTSHNPLPFLYSRVEVYKGSYADHISKTVYEYTNELDCPILVPTLEKPYSNRPRFLPWAYGNLKRVRVYNKDNQPVTETFNSYTFYHNFGNNSFESSKAVPLQTYISTQADAGDGPNYISFSYDLYTQIFGRVELTTTYQRTYALDGSYKEDKVDYFYDPTTYLIKRINTSNEKGELIEKRIYYPSDYTIGGSVMQQMKAANILYEPISTETWLYKTPSSPLLVETEVNDFQIIPNGDIRPVRKYSLNTTIPVAESVIQPFNPGLLVRNTTYIKEVSKTDYDSKGVPFQTIVKDRIGATVYGDNGELPIAIAENSPLSNIAYSSFEKGESGNWNINASGQPVYIDDITTPTGNRCLSIASVSSLSRNNIETGKYILTYWSKGGNVNVVEGVVVETKTGPTVNGWTLYFLTINGSQQISVAGTGMIDELRLYPLGARMRTMTHNEWGSLLTDCATDNSVLKYQYDELGRQISSKDQQGNILRYVEFRYRQQ